MSITITHRSGMAESHPTESKIKSLLKELDIEDNEHPDVAIHNDKGWCISAFPSGLVVFENVEDSNISPRHIKSVDRNRVVEIFIRFSRGKLDLVEQEEWEEGYG